MSTLPTRTDISGAPSNATARTALTAIYDMIAQRLAAGTSGAGVATDAELKLARESLQVPHRNYIDNPIGPAGIVYQRTVAATADDAYFADRWYALTQTATVTPSIITAPEAGFASGLRVTQSQATAQRYGFAQILPADYVNELVSGNASCSFRARISNTTTLRFALLGWTGTADTVISDVVNDWTSTNYSTGNFFITGGGSLSVIATGSQAMTANTFATLSLAAAAIPATAKNLILFCWTDSTQAEGTNLDFHDARLTKTDVRVPVITRPLEAETFLCYFRLFVAVGYTGVVVNRTDNNQNFGVISLPRMMAANGTFTLFSSAFSGHHADLFTAFAQGSRGQIEFVWAGASYRNYNGQFTCNFQISCDL